MQRMTRLFIGVLFLTACMSNVCMASEGPESGNVPTRGMLDSVALDDFDSIPELLGQAGTVVGAVRDVAEDVQEGRVDEAVDQASAGCFALLKALLKRNRVEH